MDIDRILESFTGHLIITFMIMNCGSGVVRRD